MNAVRGGQGEIKRKEQLHLTGVGRRKAKVGTGNQMLMEFVGVLDTFDAQEGGAEQHRQQQENDQRLALPHLCAANRQGHRQTAADQHGGVDAPEHHIELGAAEDERLRIGGAVGGVAREQTAEQHHLGQQEGPQPERGGLALLLSVLKLMRQRG